MKFIHSTSFASATGQIRVRETKFLKDSDIERLLSSKSADEAFEIVRSLDLAKDIKKDYSLKNFTELLNQFLVQEKRFIEKNNPYPELLNFLWHEYDFHNMKVFLKQKIKTPHKDQDLRKKEEETEKTSLFYDMGTLHVEDLRKFIIDDERVISVPEKWKKYKERILRYYEQFQNTQAIELACDRSYFNYIVRENLWMEKKKAKFLKDFITARIDLANIKIFLRLKSFDENIELLEKALIYDGSIDVSFFKDSINRPVAEWVNRFPDGRYKKLIENGYRSYQEEGSFVFLEKESDNYLLKFLKNTKYQLFGPEILLAYFWNQRNTAQILKMILLAKINAIDREEILQRIRVATL